MKRKMGFVFVVVCLLFPTICFAAAADYFPLLPGSEYQYRGYYNGKTYDDHILIQEVSGRSGWVYFINTIDSSDDVGLIAGTSFGLGAYKKMNSGIFTVDVSFKNYLPSTDFSKPQLLLGIPLDIGQNSNVSNNNLTNHRTLRTVGFETITVPAGTFNCIKIEMTTEWVKTKRVYISHIWLAPGVGMVKWIRDTGRIDELMFYKIPI